MSTDIESGTADVLISRRITVKDVQAAVAKAYDMSVQTLLTRTRRREIARPRQIAMYLATRLTSVSLPDIGDRFGGFDHTTVMYARDRIAELAEQDPDMRQMITKLVRAIRAD